MKELEYPFDSGFLLKKRKALKKQLLADNTKRIKKNVAILGGSTTNDIMAMLELFLLNTGIEPAFYQSEYAQYWQDAMFPSDELLDFKPDIIFIHTTNRNIKNYPTISDSQQTVCEKLELEYNNLVQMWQKLAENFHCPIIQNNFELPYFRLMGNKDASDFHGRVNFITNLNCKLYSYAQENANFFINDINYLSASYGLEKWSEPSAWHMYKYALCMQAIPEFSYNVSNIIKSVFGKNKKALVLDLDNTLWGGVVGDDGVDGIEIGQETSMGQVYSEFQKYLRLVKDMGIMLTVCSKNDEENAIAGLNHPEGSLKPDDFIIIKANWENKDRNIIEIASQLNIMTDSLVFLDDNPAERAIVTAQVSGISAPPMDLPENYIRVVDRSGFFEVTAFSQDDLKRNDMYKANVKRSQQQAQFGDYNEYLLSLEMNGVIDDFLPVYLQRITQLTNKSNQFNVTTKRYTAAEMELVYNSKDYIRLYGKLADKFGDNGIVSVVIGKKNGKNLDIQLWLMSCRVLKRDMEFAMLDQLVEKCRECGIETINGYYYPTAKNKMVADLFDRFGFTKISENDNMDTVWSLSTKTYEKKNKVINISKNEG